MNIGFPGDISEKFAQSPLNQKTAEVELKKTILGGDKPLSLERIQ